MSASLEYRREYLRAKQDLSLNARLRLWGVEVGIGDDPDHRRNRIETVLGRRAVVLELNGELLVYFHRLDSGRVSMDLVVDLADPPEWFTQPTGTWFGAIDLR